MVRETYGKVLERECSDKVPLKMGIVETTWNGEYGMLLKYCSGRVVDGVVFVDENRRLGKSCLTVKELKQ